MVVIKKMNLPESCYSCDIRMNCDACEGHEMYCPFVGHIGYDPESKDELVEGVPICPTDHRAEGCPLEEYKTSSNYGGKASESKLGYKNG